MLPQESRERIRHFTKLLRIPTMGVDNITVDDLNVIINTLDQMATEETEGYQTPLLLQLRRFLEMSCRSIPISPNIQISQNDQNIQNSSILELKSMVQAIIDYKNSNTP